VCLLIFAIGVDASRSSIVSVTQQRSLRASPPEGYFSDNDLESAVEKAQLRNERRVRRQQSDHAPPVIPEATRTRVEDRIVSRSDDADKQPSSAKKADQLVGMSTSAEDMKTARLKTSEEFRHDATATRNRFKKIAVASTATVESKSLVSRNPKEGNEAKNAKGGEIKIKVGDTASSLIGPGDESADAEDSTKAVEPPADVNAKEGDVKAKEAKAPKYDISSGPHPKKIVSALNSYFGKEKHASSPMAQGHDILDMIRSLDISDKDSDETATQSATET